MYKVRQETNAALSHARLLWVVILLTKTIQIFSFYSLSGKILNVIVVCHIKLPPKVFEHFLTLSV